MRAGLRARRIEMVRDPVCGTEVSKEMARMAEGLNNYKHKTYYFCSRPCKVKFLKEPEKYVAKKQLSNDRRER